MRCKITSPRAKVVQELSSNIGLKCFNHCKLSITALHLTMMWCLKDKFSSIQQPKYQIILLLSMLSPHTCMLLDVHFCNCWCDPSIKNSVFLLFIFNRLLSIHPLMSFRVDSRVCMVLFSSVLDAPGKLLSREWSLANPLIETVVGTTSWIVLA